MKFIVSLLVCSSLVAGEEFPGRSMYDMTVDSFGLSHEVSRNIKGLYPDFLEAIRAVNGQDCQKFKTSGKNIARGLKDLLKHGSDVVLKESQFDSQMQMMAQMAQSFVLTQIESHAEHLIDTHSCVMSGIHKDYNQDDL